MRAAVVLRHVEGLSVSEAASVMACSEGTVKSQTARGLDKLRDQLDDDDLRARMGRESRERVEREAVKAQEGLRAAPQATPTLHNTHPHSRRRA